MIGICRCISLQIANKRIIGFFLMGNIKTSIWVFSSSAWREEGEREENAVSIEISPFCHLLATLFRIHFYFTTPTYCIFLPEHSIDRLPELHGRESINIWFCLKKCEWCKTLSRCQAGCWGIAMRLLGSKDPVLWIFHLFSGEIGASDHLIKYQNIMHTLDFNTFDGITTE